MFVHCVHIDRGSSRTFPILYVCVLFSMIHAQFHGCMFLYFLSIIYYTHVKFNLCINLVLNCKFLKHSFYIRLISMACLPSSKRGRLLASLRTQ